MTTYCQSRCLVKRSFDGDEVGIITIGCRSWSCEHCAERMRQEIKRRIQDGKPNTFITLTCNPSIGINADARRAAMAKAWHVLVGRIKRKYGYAEFPYYVIVEKTRNGEPHFHIAARVPWIDQRWLSSQWDALTGARIVDIRRVRTARGVARYLAKYLAKDPADFHHKRRAWGTPGWRERKPKRPSLFADINGWWTVATCTLAEQCDILMPHHLNLMIAAPGWAYASTQERWHERAPALLGKIAQSQASRSP
jgi:hypothetical protein